MAKVDFSKVLAEIERYSDTYEFNFQFWGPDNNNVYLSKGHVELMSAGGLESPRHAMVTALKYLYKINRVKDIDRVC